MTDAAAGGDGDAVSTTSPITLREHVRGARYGEVLLVTGHLHRLEATVYNTLGLNDCPDDLWQALDAEAIKETFRARAVILNGPRYFLMDKIGTGDSKDDIVAFGGLRMRKLATLPLSPAALRGDRQHYTEQAVRRTTVYVYEQGSEVYELMAPSGTRYVMQSCARTVDPTLTVGELPRLGTRLQLPAGWRYETRRLADEWVLRAGGEARVVQDELENSYQRVEPPSAP